MNSKWIVISAILILILAGGAFFLLSTNKSSNPTLTTQTVTQAPAQRSENVSPTSAPPTETTINEAQITLTAQGFTPQTITIKKGAKVVWTNKSGVNATVDSAPHPFHTSYSPLNLGNFGDGEKLELVFNEAGTYKYHNHLNSSNQGTIIVE